MVRCDEEKYVGTTYSDQSVVPGRLVGETGPGRVVPLVPMRCFSLLDSRGDMRPTSQ